MWLLLRSRPRVSQQTVPSRQYSTRAHPPAAHPRWPAVQGASGCGRYQSRERVGRGEEEVGASGWSWLSSSSKLRLEVVVVCCFVLLCCWGRWTRGGLRTAARRVVGLAVFLCVACVVVGDGAGREGVAGLIGSAEEWGSSLVRGVSVSTKFKSGTRGATSFLVPGTARCCPGHAQHLTRLLQGGGGGWQRPAIGGRPLRHRWKLSFLHVLGAPAAHTNLCPVLYPFSRRRDVISPSPDIARADLSIVVIKTMFGSSAPSIGSFYELQFHSREKTRRCESSPTSPFLELSHWARIAASSPKTSDIQHAYPAILWKMGIGIDIAT